MRHSGFFISAAIPTAILFGIAVAPTPANPKPEPPEKACVIFDFIPCHRDGTPYCDWADQ